MVKEKIASCFILQMNNWDWFSGEIYTMLSQNLMFFGFI